MQDQKALALAALLNEELVTRQDFLAALADDWGHTMPVLKSAQNRKSLTLDFGDALCIIMLINAPIPTHTFGNLLNHEDEQASTNFANHKSHAVVSVLSDKFKAIGKFIILTKIMTTLCQFENVAGIYWPTLPAVYYPDNFRLHGIHLQENRLPLLLWIKIHKITQDDNSHDLVTAGLTSLGLKEIEIHRVFTPLDELYNIIVNLCHYLLEKGPVLGEGDALNSSQFLMHISFQPSRYYPAEEAMVLTIAD